MTRALTQAEIEAAASAPHTHLPDGAYPGTCRDLTDDEFVKVADSHVEASGAAARTWFRVASSIGVPHRNRFRRIGRLPFAFPVGCVRCALVM